MVVARTQFAPCIGRGVAIEAERKAAAGDIGLVETRHAEALRLQRRVGRHPADHGCEAIAAFGAAAEALRVEVGGEMVTEGGKAVGRHPMVGEGERTGEIPRTGAGGGVDAGLERVAPAAAEALRQAPVGATAGERKAGNGVGREVIVEPAGDAKSAGGEIMAADDCRIAVGVVITAVAASPRAPARLEGRRRRLGQGRLHRFGISEGNVPR